MFINVAKHRQKSLSGSGDSGGFKRSRESFAVIDANHITTASDFEFLEKCFHYIRQDAAYLSISGHRRRPHRVNIELVKLTKSRLPRFFVSPYGANLIAAEGLNYRLAAFDML